MTLTSLELILLLLAASVLAVAGLRHFNLPPLLGYLLVGVVLGPHAANIAAASSSIDAAAHFGVVFLMFSIGLEFNLGKLHSMRRHVFALGGLQVGATMLLAVGASLAAVALLPASLLSLFSLSQMDWRAALVLGGTLAMSSTALAVKMLADKRELETEHGKRALAILLFQDLAVIPLLVLIPALAQGGQEWISAIGFAVLKASVLLFLLFRLGRRGMRWWLLLVARKKSHELFTLNVLLVTLFLAWLTQLFGLSLELGAFVAGMLIAETEFRYQVEEDIKSFRDVLLGLFFITLGMQLNLGIVLAQWWLVLVFTVVPVTLKFVLISAFARWLGASTNTSLRTGLWLAQAGEFGFVLLTQAAGARLVEPALLQPILAAMLLSMVIAPLILQRADWLLLRVSNQEWMQRSLQLQRIASTSIVRDKHVIICGFGRCGQAVAHMLETEKVSTMALDLDPDRVREASAAGESVVFGDSARREALIAAGIHRASALVVSFHDVHAAVRVLAQVRALAPKLPVLVRCADDSEIPRLREAGATEVVPEIVEGSIVLASHAMALAGVPLNTLQQRMRKIRDDQYVLLRGFFHGADDTADVIEGEQLHLRTVALEVGAGAIGRRLGDVGLEALRIKVTAINRQQQRVITPDSETVLRLGDLLVLSGTVEALADAERALVRG
jgi:monovalent cation:H+ antiporter-2, CPA2 family